MKKCIVFLVLSSLLFWGCRTKDESGPTTGKIAPKDESSLTTSKTPATGRDSKVVVAVKSNDGDPAKREALARNDTKTVAKDLPGDVSSFEDVRSDKEMDFSKGLAKPTASSKLRAQVEQQQSAPMPSEINVKRQKADMRPASPQSVSLDAPPSMPRPESKAVEMADRLAEREMAGNEVAREEAPAAQKSFGESSPDTSVASTETSGIADAKAKKEGGRTVPPTKIVQPKVWQRAQPQSNVARVKVGNQEFLQLKSVRVMVKVEGLRARTIIDHVFYNPYDRQLQGTFEYKLPDDASICYFAFAPDVRNTPDVRIGDTGVALPKLPQARAQSVYSMPVEEMLKQEPAAFGELKVAHVVPKEKALVAYEETVRGNIDPALVEWAGGNTFSVRIFPLHARNYQRVVIAYEQTLTQSQGQNRYNFFFPAERDVDVSFMLVTSKGYAGKDDFNMDVRPTETDAWKSYLVEAKSEALQVNHAEYLFLPPAIESIAGEERPGGTTYLYARLMPDLPTLTTGQGAAEAVFMMDTSLSQDPDEFGIALKLLERILQRNSEIQRFNILFFNVEARWFNPGGWLNNTESGRQEALNRINQVILEGATDIDTALQALTKPEWLNQPGKLVDVFFLSNGQGTWGDPLLRRIWAKFAKQRKYSSRFYCYNFGLGSANQDLFSVLTEQGGNVFACAEESQLNEVAVAHKRAMFTMERMEAQGLSDVLLSQSSANFYPGQQVLLAAKATSDNPSIVFHGTFQGAQRTLRFALKPALKGILAPRAFGEMAVRRMESMEEPALERTIVAFARYFAVPGKTCSLLMLERPEDYERFQIDLRQDVQSVQTCAVTGEISKVASAMTSALTSAKTQFADFWEKLQQNPVVKLRNIEKVAPLIGLLQKDDFEIPQTELNCTLQSRSELPQEYVSARAQNPKNPFLYLNEGERRYGQNLVFDYIRCLSSVVELEPQNTGSLRMVGYSFLQKRLAEQALGLFARVRDQRPFEPHSYRDLAKCYATLGKYGAAAAYYEIVLAGTWHDRFGQLQTVVQDEYLRMIRQMIQKKSGTREQRQFLGNRLEELCSDPTYKQQADIVVTMAWNTDNTDVDLWVTEPDGEQCGYSHMQTRLGGRLLQDITRGYGPERYWMVRGAPGKYKVEANYYAGDRTKLSDTTFVEITVTTNAGRPQEKSENFIVMLTSHRQRVEVAQFTWPPSRD